MKHLIYSVLLLSIVACTPSNSQDQSASQVSAEKPAEFNDYWYAGNAEITSYELQQARYGEIHSGEAVLVFVTEPFSKGKQVKLDDWRDQSDDNVSVMKLNMTKKFLTGIYPYSMMMSTFTPVSYDQYPNAFKVTTSSQEWCGHTFMQLNLKERGYQLRGFSYFESEGDIDENIKEGMLEDEIWSRLRFNPETLPMGEVELLPSTFYLRLKHRENKPKTAIATKVKNNQTEYAEQPHETYRLEYENRTLAIHYESEFPFTILGWEETYLSGFGSPETLTTTAKRINTIKSAYWGQNSNADRAIREELGLTKD